MDLTQLTDAELEGLRKMPKHVVNAKARTVQKDGTDQRNYNIVSDIGNQEFILYLRQNLRPGMEDDFSCGLRIVRRNGLSLTLCRYNGPSHRHRNHLEGNEFRFKAHIHQATGRYIDADLQPEGYAIDTDRFRTLKGALHCLVQDCAISGLDTEADAPTLFEMP